MLIFDLVLAKIPVDVARKFRFPHSMTLLNDFFQNAKISVMGSAQLSQVMTSVSKYVLNPYERT